MLAASIQSLVVPSAASQGQQVAFSAAASTDQSGASLTYNWTFGDGGTASGVNLTDPTHVYTVPNPSGQSYTVSLTVSDGTQNTATASAPITISDVPPSVDAGPSQTIYAGGTAQFNATITDAGGVGQIASIQWDFNNNGTTFNADPSANGLSNPSFSYASAGTYVVAVEATDQSGQTTEAFTTVTVKPTDALIVNAGSGQTVTAGQPLTLNGSYTDPGGTVPSSGIAWDTNYNGSTFNPVVTGTLTPSVTYATAGTYYAALQITDSTGASALDVEQITVNPVSHVGPTANAGSNQVLNAGSTASFSGSYTDPDGTVSSSGIAWDFNYDGVTFNPMMTGTLTPTYQYGTPGSYTVGLQITDSNGLTSLSTLTVTVNGVAPTVSVQGPSMVMAGQAVSYTGSASLPPGDMDTLSTAWDFNYNGTFIPSSAPGLTPQTMFTTAGTYVVAFQATDAEGQSSVATETVTVNASNMLVVNAGPDQTVSEGDSTTFSGSWTDGMGTVNTSTAQWDFNYNGSFVADPSANGTLTPTHQFTTPGTYLVALQLTDSNNMSSIGELYVDVSDVPPTVSAGSDQTVNEGSTVSFVGTATQPNGVTAPLSYAWDFDYGDHQTFTAMSTGTLTPTYVYTTPGTYEAALQVSDASGGVSLATATITVNDVAPTATVTNSGTANVGSPVTFTVSNLQVGTPGDTVTYAVDWTGSGTFQPLSSADLTVNNGSVSFSHTYATPSGPSGYNAVVQISDSYGGVTSYTSNVVVNAVGPTATFGPSAPSSNGTIDATIPFVFNVTDPSVAATQAGFTYYVSLDGGAYTSSTSPTYLLPSGISAGQHTVTGYVQDSNGLTSTPVTWTGTVQAATATQVIVVNDGTGQVQFNWNGSGGAVTVNANQTYQISGTAPGLSVTLLTTGATYQLETNASFDSITAVAGVSAVNVTVDTGVNYTSPLPWVGDGHVGNVSLPGGGSVVSIYARGDLKNLTGSSSTGAQTGLSALDLVFANLDGNITGLDKINNLQVSGWLGTSATQEVETSTGISSLTAYGVGATVYADLRQDASDPFLTANVGDGGMPDLFVAGNVASLTNAGGGDETEISILGASLKELSPMVGVIVKMAQANTVISLANTQNLIFDNASPTTIKGIEGIAGNSGISTMTVAKDLTVTNGIVVTSIGSIVASGNLTVLGTGIRTTGAITNLDVQKDLTSHMYASTFNAFHVGGDMTGQIVETNGSDTSSKFRVDGDFVGGVDAGLGGISSISVLGDFTWEASSSYLVKAKGNVTSIYVRGDIGELAGAPPEPSGKIVAASIQSITTNANILLASIETTAGDLSSLNATAGTLQGSVIVQGGELTAVDVKVLAANLTAKTTAAAEGKIGTVTADTSIDNNVAIRADGTIGTITVTTPVVGAVETFAVFAGAPGLAINVGKADFLGTVTLTKSSVLYTANQTLLTVTAGGNPAIVWKVTGAGTGSLDEPLVFTKLKDGTFGWVQIVDPFSINSLEIDPKAPQGAK